MDESTTTVTSPADEGATEVAQPNEQEQGTAANKPQEPPTNAEEQTGPAAADNSEWLKNKGIDASDPEAVSKLADMARNAEKAMHEKAMKASELEKTISSGTQEQIADATAQGQVDTADIALARIAALELQNSVNSFFTSNPDAKQHEQAMVKLVTDRPEVGQLVRQGALSVSDLYSMARGSDPSAVAEAKAQGGQQALQQLANKQTAAAIPGAATTSAVVPQKGDPIAELWASD